MNVHLDAHVVVWLYEGRVERLGPAARQLLRGARPVISPMVRLELAFLHQNGRISVDAPVILDALRTEADLGEADAPFARVAAIAATLGWTRDPFDRLICAHALADDQPLLTADREVLARCPVARAVDA